MDPHMHRMIAQSSRNKHALFSFVKITAAVPRKQAEHGADQSEMLIKSKDSSVKMTTQSQICPPLKIRVRIVRIVRQKNGGDLRVTGIQIIIQSLPLQSRYKRLFIPGYQGQLETVNPDTASLKGKNGRRIVQKTDSGLS